jgi:hypothetical protein
MLYAQLIVYNMYSWLFSENPTHFLRGWLKAGWDEDYLLKVVLGRVINKHENITS